MNKVEETLALTDGIKELAKELAKEFANKHHRLFLGRGDQSPIAMEGELKHGPLALIDDEMPVIVVAPNNELLEKLKSNVEDTFQILANSGRRAC